MKKIVVSSLLVLFILGFSSIALAASATVNPFQKVPASHWTYDALKQLAKDGILEEEIKGVKGSSILTRYEIGVFVAQATDNYDKANADDKEILNKLQNEYAAELQGLGVRLSNAEKKEDKVTFSGETYVQYEYKHNDFGGVKTSSNPFSTRTRLYTNYKINDQWSFTTRLQNSSTLNKTDKYESETLGKDGTQTLLNEAYVTGNIFGGKYSLGRQGRYATVLDGLVYDGLFKGILINYQLPEKFQITGRYGEEVPTSSSLTTPNTYGSLELKKDIGSAQLGLAYHTFTSDEAGKSKNIWQGYASTPLSSLFAVAAGYARANAASDNVTYSLKLSYKNTDINKVGSYQLWTQYRYIEKNSTIASTYDVTNVNSGGSDGYEIGTAYVPWKSVIWKNEYINAKSITDHNSKTKFFYSRLWFFF